MHWAKAGRVSTTLYSLDRSTSNTIASDSKRYCTVATKGLVGPGRTQP